MTTRHLIPRPERGDAAARAGRSWTGSLLLTALMVALPALAAPAAADRDKPQQIQQRQSTRASKAPARQSSPPPRSSAPPQRSTPPPSTSSAPPRTSSPPPTASSAPPQTVNSKPRTVSPPRHQTPVRTYRSDDDGRRSRTFDTGSRGYDGQRNDHRAHGNRDRDRAHRDYGNRGYRGHRHHRYCGHSYGGYYGGYYGYRHYPWYWPWFPSIYVEADYRSADHGWGALDLDVSPEEAEVYLDGQYVGIADEYDGFPSYLWLQEGTYDLAIYYQGYETIFRQVSIYPGIVIDVESSMRSGESIHPDDYGPSSTARREARVERNREKEAYARDLEEREAARETWSSDDPASAAGANIGRLFVSVLPPDAAVYLDGHFLGTAGEIGQLSAGLVVEPGDHVLELVRPGYETHREEIVVPPGERVTMELELDRD